jgi:hypothetical protein
MRSAALLIGTLLTACSTLLTACVTDAGDESTSDGGGDGKADGSGTSHTLPGFDETLLVGSSTGKLAVVHVGDTFTKKTVSLSSSRTPNVIHAHAGVFYALLDSGKLVAIDAKTAKVVRTLAVGESPQDVAWLDDATIAVSTGSRVDTFELASGTRTASLELAALRNGTGTVVTRRMLAIEGRLFIQVARTRADGKPENGALAVIEGGELVTTIELDGLNPDFDLVHDPRRGMLYVTCAGVRPSNTGVMVRIDLATLAVHDRIPAQSGWQGIVQFGEPYETLFVIYHTSTPTTSTHLFARPVAEDGTLGESHGGTIVDAFDGLDALAMNDSGTLVALANHCAAGFCIGGAGVSFIDAATQQKQPKLMAAQLGFEPVIVEFAR